MFCTSCGTELREGARFCEECGAPVEGQVASTPEPSAPQPFVMPDQGASQPYTMPDQGASQPYAAPQQPYSPPAYDPQPAYASLDQQQSPKRPFFKSPVFWVIAVVLAGLVFSAVSCASFVSQVVDPENEEAWEELGALFEMLEERIDGDDTESGGAPEFDNDDQGGSLVLPDGATVECDAALVSAVSYIGSGCFSPDRLVHQLEFEKYSTKQAQAAVSALDGVWEGEAYEAALRWVGYAAESSDPSKFTKEYVVNLMVSGDEFPEEMAQRAADKVFALEKPPADCAKAVSKARSYLSSTFSAKSLEGQLEYNGYSKKQREYAVNNCGADYDHEALESALRKVCSAASRGDGKVDAKDLVRTLVSQNEFTQAEAEQGVARALAILSGDQAAVIKKAAVSA